LNDDAPIFVVQISCDSDPLRALVSAERCAFFEAYEIAARKMLPLKSHKDRLPSAAIVSTALSALRENNETLIYQFSFNAYQITWIALPTGGMNLLFITEVLYSVIGILVLCNFRD
jgi:hypothetical protein